MIVIDIPGKNLKFSLINIYLLHCRKFLVWDFVVGIFARKSVLNMDWYTFKPQLSVYV